MFDLNNKVAVVTGATRGIGKAIALGLAEAGADIALVQRSFDEQTKDEIEKKGVKCNIIKCDLSNLDEVDTVIPEVVKRMGTVDILVNNAGIQKRHRAVDFPMEDWEEVIKINLTAVWKLCQSAGRIMTEKKSGKIINIASLVSYQGGVFVPAYTSAKGAVGQLTKALANEWSSLGVNVNAIIPGYIDTEMNKALIEDETRSRQILERIPANRWGKPSDFIGPVLFLASNASEYVHGHLLAVDGGWLGR